MKYNNLTAGFFLRRKLHTFFVVCLAVAVSSCTPLYEAFSDTETLTFYVPSPLAATTADTANAGNEASPNPYVQNTNALTVGNEAAPNTDAEMHDSQADTPPTLMWIDATGSVRREPISALVAGQRNDDGQKSAQTASEEVTSPGEPSSETERQTLVSIAVSKGLVTPVLLFRDDYVQPLGFIYPFEAEFTEAGGFAAHILYRLIHESDGDKNAVRLYCAHFNWQKFLQNVKKLDDPWHCDQTLILQSIADGTFKAHMLKTRP